MQYSIRLSLSLAGTTALALASIPFGAARAEDTKVAQGSAKDLGVMSISLKDAIHPILVFKALYKELALLIKRVLVVSYH